MKLTMNNSNITKNDRRLNIESCLILYAIHAPPSSYITNAIAACVVNVVFCIVGVVLNSLVLFIFWKSERLRSKLSYFTIMLLSAIDFGAVTIGHPLFVFKSVKQITDTDRCVYQVSYFIALALFSASSMWTLWLINIERYFSIAHPILHHVYITKRRFVIVWLLVILYNTCGLVASFYISFWEKIATANNAIICFTSFYTYASIFVIARKKFSKLARNAGQESHNTTAFLRELKTAKIYVMVFFLTLICYFPGLVVFRLDNSWRANEKTPVIVTEATMWAFTSVSMSSTLNCLVFFWGNRELRKQGSKILQKYFQGQEDQQIDLNVV